MFTSYGIPEPCKTGNDLPFNGSNFSEYARYAGFEHKTFTQLWLEANGQVENLNKTLKAADYAELHRNVTQRAD